jgi:hypothetical protein
MFLTEDDLVVLTGRPQKSKQIEQLRKMGVPFYVNAVGKPIVARATIEGRPTKVKPPEPRWSPPD